ALPDARLAEDANEVGVEVLVFHAEVQDIQRALERNRFLVWAVARGERVVDVRDAHHLRLHGNLLGAETIRVAGAVQSLVVRAGDDGHAPQRFSPRNLGQEAEGVRDVPADFV